MLYRQLQRSVETYRAGLLGFLFEEQTRQLLTHVPHHLTDIGPYLWGLDRASHGNRPKGDGILFVKQRLCALGAEVLVIDVGVLGAMV
jgi:hypothetical protein